MKHLLKRWGEFKGLFINPIFLMSDFDGTLVPIMDKPEDVKLSNNMRNILVELFPNCPIAIVSGRSLKDLKSKIQIKDIYYSGNHGFEIDGPRINFVKEEAKRAKKAIEKICKEVKNETKSMNGLIIENKEYTASFHYRLLDESKFRKLKDIVNKKTSHFCEEDIIELNYGKKVIEITPAVVWDKGKAISLLLQVANVEEDSLPIYLGDDITDEDAFSELRHKGIGILVSEEERETAADFRLNDYTEVEKFFKKLLKLLK